MKKTIKTKLIEFVIANGPVRRCDIIKHLRTAIQGMDYNPKRDRGYYSDALSSSRGFDGFRNNYLMRPTKSDHRYLKKNAEGLYVAADCLY